MTAEPKIDARRLGRLRECVHSEEQREYAGAPPPPDDRDSPPPPDDMDPTQRKRSRVDPNDPRPLIVLSTDQPDVVDQAERALAAYGGVYVRTRYLVRVVRDRGTPDWMRRIASRARAAAVRAGCDPEAAVREAMQHAASWEGVPVISRLTENGLTDLLGRAARWEARTAEGSRAASVPAW